MLRRAKVTRNRGKKMVVLNLQGRVVGLLKGSINGKVTSYYFDRVESEVANVVLSQVE
jgi:hypothetical protein